MKKALPFILLVFFGISTYSQWTTGTNIYNTNSGNVGIGTSNPTSLLDVQGDVAVGAGTVNTNNTKLFIRNEYPTTGKTWALSAGLNKINETSFGIYNWTDDYNATTNTGTPFFTISATGRVGIGTSNPNSLLNVDPQGAGNITVGNPNTSTGNYTSLSLGISAQTNGYSQLQCISAAGSSYGNIVLNPSGGNILIGKTSQTSTGTHYLLDVDGDVRGNKLVVNTTGADYVFDSSYKLLPLNQVESFIKQNHHLPEIISADSMKNNGLDVGENQTKLLQKIEELTLYVIQQNKVINEQNSQLEYLKSKMDLLEQKVQSSEKSPANR